MNINIDIINKLIDLCDSAYSNGEIPVAAVILDKYFNPICFSSNSRQFSFSVLNHAEVNVIVDAESIIKDWRLDGYYLLSTLEPCDMCSAIIKESRIDKVFYLLPRNSVSNLPNDFIIKDQLSGFDLEKEKLKKLLTSFFEEMR